MAIATLEDLDGTVEVLFFPSSYQKAAGYIKKDGFIYVKGRLSLREEEPKIIANEASDLEDAFGRFSKSITVVMKNHGGAALQKENFEELKRILSQYQGDVPVYVVFPTKNNGKVQMRIGKELYVKPSLDLMNEVERLFGEGSVVVRC
jgi:DNA polymerase-3 subunit alpha